MPLPSTHAAMMAETDARPSLGLASVSVATDVCVYHASGASCERMVLVSTVKAVETSNITTSGTDDDSVAVDARDHGGRDRRETLTGARVRACGHGHRQM